MENTTANDNAVTQGPVTTTNSNGPYRTDLRRKNPLSELSSYTYIITLYMVTPEAANYFTQYNRLPPYNGGANRYFIVAKSGGINNEAEPRGLTFNPSEPGPKKPGLDFYIDDLNIETYMLAQDGSKTATLSNKISFKVIEPEGFTFLTKLSELSATINQLSPSLQENRTSITLPNLYQQHYIIGIKFYGYNPDGTIKENNQEVYTGDNYVLFERLFPVKPQNVTFRLVPKNPIIYNWEGVVLGGQVALGSKHGVLNSPANIEGETVGEILGSAPNESPPKSLIGWLNNNQLKLKEQGYIDKPTTYSINWLDKETDSEIKSIFSSKMNDKDKLINEKAPMATVQSIQDITIKQSTDDANNKINTNVKSINVPYGKPIVSTIDQIIINSQYVKDKASIVTNSAIATTIDPNLGASSNASGTAQNSPGGSSLKWYAIKPLVTCNGRDSKTNDWAYNITYEISSYDVPYVKNQFIFKKSNYYGPIKQYDYFFTGKNTEVINYEQEYNNLFYTIVPPSATVENKASVGTNGFSSPARVGRVNTDASMGTNNDNDIAGAVRASLYSVKDAVRVNLKIMGDPDFLMDSIGSATQPENISKFYSINNSINPYSGQLFIEINFGLAEDYGSNGLMDLDPKKVVGFYSDQDRKALGTNGIIYRVNKVDSVLSKGKFEQTLELYLVLPGEFSQTTTPTREVIPDAATTRGLLNAADRDLRSAPSTVTPPASSAVKKGTSPPGYVPFNERKPLTIPQLNEMRKNQPWLPPLPGWLNNLGQQIQPPTTSVDDANPPRSLTPPVSPDVQAARAREASNLNDSLRQGASDAQRINPRLRR